MTDFILVAPLVRSDLHRIADSRIVISGIVCGIHHSHDGRMLVVLDFSILKQGLITGIGIIVMLYAVGQFRKTERSCLHKRCLATLDDLLVPVAGLLLLADVLVRLGHIEFRKIYI